MRADDWQAHLRVGDRKKSLEAVGLDTGQKRAITMNLVEDYAIASTCGVLALPRSSYYYQASQQEEQQAELQAALLRLAAQWPTYGYRRLTAHLHREGWRVNSKRVRELMAQLGLTKHARPRKVRTTNSQHSFWRYPIWCKGSPQNARNRFGSPILRTFGYTWSSCTWRCSWMCLHAPFVAGIWDVP